MYIMLVYIIGFINLPRLLFPFPHMCAHYKSYLMNTVTLWDTYYYQPTNYTKGNWRAKRLTNHPFFVFYFCVKSLPKSNGLKQTFSFPYECVSQEFEKVLSGQDFSHRKGMSRQLGLENPLPAKGGFFPCTPAALLLFCLSFSQANPSSRASPCSMVSSLIKVENEKLMKPAITINQENQGYHPKESFR